MSYTCLLMFLCECANLISKANFSLLDRTDLFIRLHVMFQISFQSSKGQKSYLKFLGVRSELLLSIFNRRVIVRFFIFQIEGKMGSIGDRTIMVENVKDSSRGVLKIVKNKETVKEQTMTIIYTEYPKYRKFTGKDNYW